MKIVKYTSVFLLVVAFVTSFTFSPATAQAKNSSLSISGLIEMLISLEIIPADKADAARELASGQADDDATDNSDVTKRTCAYGQFKKALALGSEGDDVTQLQELLAEDGDIYPEGKVTGYFGPLTEKAVKRYQEKYGIDQVGIVGPQTRARMQEQYQNCLALKKQEQAQKQAGKTDDEDKEDEDTDEDEDTGNVTEISLSIEDEDEGIIAWESEEPSPKGFKIIWSMNDEPTYPTKSGDKAVLSYNKVSGERDLHAFDGPGTYYVRVCEYLGGGKCGTYSNEVEIELDSEYTSEVDEIELTEGNRDNEVEWEVDGYSTKGFKVVWSMDDDPTYPTDNDTEYEYHENSSDDDAVLEAFDGPGTYYVRVCEYLGGDECGTWSNELEIELEGDEVEEEEGDVNTIVLEQLGDTTTVTWEVDGYSDDGFKVVWSMEPEPTYPVRTDLDQYKYLSDSDADEATLNAFDGDGTYYVRVCEYLGGSCGVYSNEVEMYIQ